MLPYFIHPLSFYRVDVCDREAGAYSEFRVVIHLAALVGYPLCKNARSSPKGQRRRCKYCGSTPSHTCLVYVDRKYQEKLSGICEKFS